MAITDAMAAQVLSTHKAKKINVLFLETSQYVLGLVSRQAFFFFFFFFNNCIFSLFLYRKGINIIKNTLGWKTEENKSKE